MQSKILLALAATAAALPSITKRNNSPWSDAKTFAVTDFTYNAQYIFSSPSHQNSYGSLFFNVTTCDSDAVAFCSAGSRWLTDFFYGINSYNCTGLPEGQTLSFLFDKPNEWLALTSSSGTGNATNLDLDCEETFEENDDWEIGEIYSERYVVCKPIDFIVKIE